MNRPYPTDTPPMMRAIYDKFCVPQRVRGLPIEHNIQLMTATVDRWDMRRASPSGPHEANMSMWAYPFDGGIAIAAHILKNPEGFTGRTVLDIGAGSGLVAIAAAKAGATAIAIDSSPTACLAMATNAALNEVNLTIGEGDVAAPQSAIWINDDIYSYREIAMRADIITAGDIFFDAFYARQIATTLSGFAKSGKTIYASSGEEDMDSVFKGAAIDVLGRYSYEKRPNFVRLPPSNPHP